MDGQSFTDPIEVERYLRSMFDAMFEGIQILDSDWRYVYLNETASDQGRQPRDHLLGKTMMEAYPGIEETEMFHLLERAMAERTPQQMVNRFSYPDGQQAWFDLRIYPTPEGGLLILSVDITAQREADEMLRQSQKMQALGRLAGGVAHDFNNLLSVITSYSDVILRGVAEGERYHRELKEIKRAAEHAASLTRQLLDFSRKRALQPGTTDVNQVVEGIDALLRRVIGEDIELVTRLTDEPALVRLDSGQLQQVLMNLAVNARDAMPQGGRLTIETEAVDLTGDPGRDRVDVEPGPFVRITVSDTGTGMDEATRNLIFEPFFTTKELGRGTGLGLATTYGIVTQSGGSVAVDSQPGEGSTFRLYLPRVASAAQAEESPQARRAGVGTAGSGTILVVDDDPAVRDVIRTVLELAGYTILDSGTVDEALNLVRSHEGAVDLMLTDLILPGMKGHELARLATDARPGLAVVYMSGYMDDAMASSGILKPGTPYIEKPFTADELMERVAKALGH